MSLVTTCAKANAECGGGGGGGDGGFGGDGGVGAAGQLSTQPQSNMSFFPGCVFVE